MGNDKQRKIASISIQKTASILDAFKVMDTSYRRLLLVFYKNKFLNVISIGDLQRAIIKNKPLETPIHRILRKDTTVCWEKDSLSEIKAKMMKFRAECMPVMNHQKELIDVHFWEDLFSTEGKINNYHLNIPVVIMAGGKGLRMKPLTNVLPKPLIPIGDKSIVEKIIDSFRLFGCDKFYLSVNYKAALIKHYLENINHEDYNISYLHEEKPLGTAGSLFLLKGKVDTSFFVTNCDIIIDEDYWEIYNYHKENANDITIVAALKNYPIPYGTLETGYNGILQSINEKPDLTFKINSGMYILEPGILHEIPDNEHFNITDLIEKIRAKGLRVGVFPVSENSWMDIGNWSEYLKSLSSFS